MVRNLGPCSCCGGVPDCTPPLGIPSAYKLIIQSLTGKPVFGLSRHHFACGGARLQSNEDRFAACESINGTYILNYGGAYECQGHSDAVLPFGQGPEDGFIKFHYWMGSAFTINGLSTVTTSTTTVDTCLQTHIPITTPTSYIFVAARKDGRGLLTDPFNPGLPYLEGAVDKVAPPVCAVELYLIPTIVLSTRITYLRAMLNSYGPTTISNNLCNFMYNGSNGCSCDWHTNVWGADQQLGFSTPVCLENMNLNTCYTSRWTFFRNPITQQLRPISANNCGPCFKCEPTDFNNYILISEII